MNHSYTRTVNGKQIPYIVAGMAGYYGLTGLKHGRQPPVPATPMSGTDASENPLSLDVFNNTHFGFVRMAVSAKSLTGLFITVDTSTGATAIGDSFAIDFASNTVTNVVSASSRPAPTGAVTKVPATKKVKGKSVAKVPIKKAGTKAPAKGAKKVSKTSSKKGKGRR